MNRLIFALLFSGLLAGCGGAMYKSYDSAYGAAPAQESTEGWSGTSGEAERAMEYDADYFFEDEAALAEPPPMSPAPEPASSPTGGSRQDAKDGYAQSKSKSKPGKGSSGGQQQTQGADGQSDRQAEDGAKQNDLEAPLVVYTGFLKMRVKRLLEAIDEVTSITEKQGGYIESLTRDVIVVRVPARDFDGVMASFGDIGETLERRIKALDVTEQFTDLGARLAVAKEARDRLLQLLEKVEDVEERLRILQEIKRLSEQIESVESTLDTLQNLVDYFTITIELVPILEDSAPTLHRSPFGWVRGLAAHKTTLYDGKDEFEMTLPEGFVLFKKDDVYRAQAADTTVFRGAVVDNEPLGTNGFWSDAVHHEMEGRAEKLIEDGDAGPLTYRLYRSEDVQPRYYLIAVYARYEDLYVVEVFYPNEDSFAEHHAGVLEALATFEVR